MKVNYGIDIGGTSASISRMENGEPVIIKTDVLTDTMPLVVYVNKKGEIQVGDSAYYALKRDKLRSMRKFDTGETNSFIEFKRTMGTDKKYHCSNLDTDFSSEDLLSEVLKKLKSFVTDENIRSIVVTVPAKFTINQKDATLRAAKLAGFGQCELLQEPIAASMAYGLDAKSKDGHWLVFDFSSGAFDAALLKAEEGIMKVIDTEGDNYLGGKSLDYAIVDEIIIPYFIENYAMDSILEDDTKKKVLQYEMKQFAEEAKIAMSFNETAYILSDWGDNPGEDDDGEEFELDITVTQDMMQEALGPIFQKAIDICKSLLERNHLDGNLLDEIILVGGATYSPVLRKMLEEQIRKPDLSVDPMTVVAKGAALFASTVDVSAEVREAQRDNTKIQLEFGYEAVTVEEEEFVTVKFLKDKTEGEVPEKLFIAVVRGDKTWASGKIELDEKGEVVEVQLNAGKANTFRVMVYNEQGDLLPNEPEGFTITQGSKIGSATLPYSIGIEVKSRESGKILFKSIKGLEKNQSTPATGTVAGIKTTKQLRPSIKEDSIIIPLYQGEHAADGTPAIYSEHVFDVIITGEDLPELLPEGSDVDLTIVVDKSERISLSAYFPLLDFTEEIEVPSNTTQKEIDAAWLENEIDKALQSIDMMRQESVSGNSEDIDKLDTEIREIGQHLENDKNDYDRKKDVLDSLRRSLRRLDKIQSASEWPKTEEELKDVFYRLEETHEKFGDEESGRLVKQFKSLIPGVMADKNIKVARDLIDNIRQLDFSLFDKGLGAQMESTKLITDVEDLLYELTENEIINSSVFQKHFDVIFDMKRATSPDYKILNNILVELKSLKQ